jgi:hypothetical protein
MSSQWDAWKRRHTSVGISARLSASGTHKVDYRKVLNYLSIVPWLYWDVTFLTQLPRVELPVGEDHPSSSWTVMDRDQLNSVASFPSYINAIARLRQLSQLPIPIDNHGTYLDLIRLTDMSPDRMHSRKNQATKPPKPTRYRPRHQSLRDLGEEVSFFFSF